MPVIQSSFSPNIFLRNAHFNTVYRTFFMKENVIYQRKRITTWDADFIDLDFSTVGAKSIVLLIHGLEGSANSKYILAAVQEFNQQKFDTVSFNLRGCSGEDNLLPYTYHSGKTEDVDFVVKHIVENYEYQNIILLGYSLGGNLILKYLGEYATQLSNKIKGAITVSVPIDLATSGVELAKRKNKIYMNQFLETLIQKVIKKKRDFPTLSVDLHQLKKSKNFADFDEIYTAPVFGYKSAQDYWQKASSKPFLAKIKLPVLFISALDDPFLSKECFPFLIAEKNKNFYLETPKYGGHVGFISTFKQEENRWLEQRILQFVYEKIKLDTN